MAAEFFHTGVGVAELVIGGHVGAGAVGWVVMWVRGRRAPQGKHRA